MDQENEDETDGKMILVKHFAFLASKKLMVNTNY